MPIKKVLPPNKNSLRRSRGNEIRSVCDEKKLRASIKARVDAIKTTLRVSPYFKRDTILQERYHTSREIEIVDEIGMVK